MKTYIILLILFSSFIITSCKTTKDFTKTKNSLEELKNNQEFDCQKDNIKSAEDLYKEASELQKKGDDDKAEIKIMAANEIIKMVKTKKCPKKEKVINNDTPQEVKEKKDNFKPNISEIKDPANENISLKVVSNYNPETIYFAFNSYQISEDAQKILLKHLDFLIANPQVNVKIGGHTDKRGSEEYNLILGEKRALVVKDFFISQGIPKERIEITTYGEEILADTGNTEEAHAKNRRVEFKFILSE